MMIAIDGNEVFRLESWLLVALAWVLTYLLVRFVDARRAKRAAASFEAGQSHERAIWIETIDDLVALKPTSAPTIRERSEDVARMDRDRGLV